MKYKDWLEIWLENYIKPNAKIRTYQRYEEIIMRHIAPKLGDYEVDKITPLIIQKFVTELSVGGNAKTHKGLAASTINGIITVIQNSLKTARAVGVISNYTADMVKRPKGAERQVECFTFAEQKLIEKDILDHQRYRLYGIVLCLYTGLRIGELLALKWENIDIRQGILCVERSCHDGKDENGKFCRITGTPKTQTSERVIPLPKQILPILKEWKKQAKSEFVVESSQGKPVLVRSYQQSFELLLKRLHIPHKGFHSLRHTFATRALECGVDVKTLSELLGHKNPTITLNRYVHSLTDHKRDMMNRLGKLL